MNLTTTAVAAVTIPAQSIERMTMCVTCPLTSDVDGEREAGGTGVVCGDIPESDRFTPVVWRNLRPPVARQLGHSGAYPRPRVLSQKRGHPAGGPNRPHTRHARRSGASLTNGGARPPHPSAVRWDEGDNRVTSPRSAYPSAVTGDSDRP